MTCCRWRLRGPGVSVSTTTTISPPLTDKHRQSVRDCATRSDTLLTDAQVETLIAINDHCERLTANFGLTTTLGLFPTCSSIWNDQIKRCIRRLPISMN